MDNIYLKNSVAGRVGSYGAYEYPRKSLMVSCCLDKEDPQTGDFDWVDVLPLIDSDEWLHSVPMDGTGTEMVLEHLRRVVLDQWDFIYCDFQRDRHSEVKDYVNYYVQAHVSPFNQDLPEVFWDWMDADDLHVSMGFDDVKERYSLWASVDRDIANGLKHRYTLEGEAFVNLDAVQPCEFEVVALTANTPLFDATGQGGVSDMDDLVQVVLERVCEEYVDDFNDSLSIMVTSLDDQEDLFQVFLVFDEEGEYAG